MIGRVSAAVMFAGMFVGFGPAAFASMVRRPRRASEGLRGAGSEQDAWVNNPHLHAFYDLTVETLGKGTQGDRLRRLSR